jgi:nucleotide-binding universal stress UspA family protein
MPDCAVALAHNTATVAVVYVHKLAVPTLAVGPFVAPHLYQPVMLTDVERAHLLQAISDFVAKDRAAGAAFEIILDEDLNIADTIVARAKTLDASVIIMGTHAVRFDRWVLGSVAEKARTAVCPGWWFRPRRWRSR